MWGPTLTPLSPPTTHHSGTKGPFTINLWFKADPVPTSEGELFGYLFSTEVGTTADAPTQADPFSAPGAHLLLPEGRHPAAGVVRAVVKDVDDSPGRSFLDSDGRYNDDGARGEKATKPTPTGARADDGRWHMATLTSRPDGETGYELYVDGGHAAEAPPGKDAVAAGETVLADGGSPLGVDSSAIYLCGRADGAPDRSFSGLIAHVALWNEALSGGQVAALYASVPADGASATVEAAAAAAAAPTPGDGVPGPAPAASAPAPSHPVARPSVVLTVTGVPCAFPFNYGGKLHTSCVQSSADPTATFCQDATGRLARCSDDLTAQYGSMRSFLDSYVSAPGSHLVPDEQGRARLCFRGTGASAGAVTKGDQLAPPVAAAAPAPASLLARAAGACPTGTVCAPLTPSQVSRLGPFDSSLYRDHFLVGGAGVCADAAPASAWPAGDATVPLPAAYFPLSNRTVTSWPVPEYALRNLTLANTTAWVEDAAFGAALECSAAAPQSAALLAGVPLGKGGPFAVNLWFRQYSAAGPGLQYLFSARPSGVATAKLDDPAYFHPSQAHIFLPSSDHPAHGLVRAIVKDSTDRYAGRPTRSWLDSDGAIGSDAPRPAAKVGALTDGEWHMATITTHPEGGKGYELYVDGTRRGAVADPLDYFHLDGGAPLAPAVDIVLCGRSDASATRFFDGRISQLALFDVPLTPNAVAALYRAGAGGRDPPRGASSAAAGDAAAATVAAVSASRGADKRDADVAAVSAAVKRGDSTTTTTTTTTPVAPPAATPWPEGPVPKPPPRPAPTVGASQRGVAAAGAPTPPRRTVSVGAAIALALLAATLTAAVAVGAALACDRRRRRGWRKEALDGEQPTSPAAQGAPGVELGGKKPAQGGSGRAVIDLSASAA